MTNTNKITAIIPVKKENGCLKNKNILPFAGSNLLCHKIQQLKQVKEIDSIIVSSDSDYMLQMAEQAGVTAIKRPSEFADDSRPFSDFVDYLCKLVESENILYTSVTAPLVDSKHYTEAIKIYYQQLSEGCDSLISVSRFQNFLLDDNGTLNFQRGKKHVNSQELPKLWSFTNGIAMAPRESMSKWHYYFGVNPYYYEISKEVAVVIHDNFDYQCALAMYQYNEIK